MAPQIILFVIVSSLFIVKVNSCERIITKENDTIHGVPIDYRYSEIFYSPYGVKSSPGCPKSEMGILPWVQYEGKCYLADVPGLPCKYGEKLFVKAGSPFGVCNCACFKHGNIPLFDFSKLQFCETMGDEYVYYPMTQECYRLYYQGPCRGSNERLVKIRSKKKFGIGHGGGWTVACKQSQCPPGKMISETDCKPAPAIQAVLVGPAVPQDCENGEVYSRLLKKCLHKPLRSSRVMGK